MVSAASREPGDGGEREQIAHHVDAQRSRQIDAQLGADSIASLRGDAKHERREHGVGFVLQAQPDAASLVLDDEAGGGGARTSLGSLRQLGAFLRFGDGGVGEHGRGADAVAQIEQQAPALEQKLRRLHVDTAREPLRSRQIDLDDRVRQCAEISDAEQRRLRADGAGQTAEQDPEPGQSPHLSSPSA